MTSAITRVQARGQSDDLCCRAQRQRQRRNVKIRRLAVVQSGGSHFELRPVRAPVAVKGG